MYPGLLSDEELASAYQQFRVNPAALNPLQMALYQAGQGIATGEGARLDQILRGAAQGGVQGYNQALQNQMLFQQYQAQQAQMEAEARRKREQEELDQQYKRALTDESAARAARENATMTEQVRKREEAKRLRDGQISQILEAQPDLNQTQRVQLRKRLEGMTPEMLESEFLQRFPTTEMQLAQAQREQEQQNTQALRERLASYTGQPAEAYAGYESKDLISAIREFEGPKSEAKPPGEADERMLAVLTQGQRGEIPKDSPEYAAAYARYYERYLRPKTYQDGSTYVPDPQFEAPPGFRSPTPTGTGDLVSEVTTEGGRLIQRMNADDKKEVRTLFSSLEKLDEFDQIVQNVDLNNLNRIGSDSPELARLSTIYTDLLMRLKEKPYNLGVITGPDMELMESILDNPAKADPTNIRAFFRDKDYYLAKINQLRGILINDTQNILRDYGGDVGKEYENRFKKPLTWIPQKSNGERKIHPKTSEVLNQVDPSAAEPASKEEESSWDWLPDPLQNIFR